MTVEPAQIDRVRSLVERFNGRDLVVAQMLELLPGVIYWECDREGVVTHSVGGGLYALGLGPGEVVGTTIHDWQDPLLVDALDRAMAGKGTTRVQRDSPIWPDICFAFNQGPKISASGRIVGMLTVVVLLPNSRPETPCLTA